MTANRTDNIPYSTQPRTAEEREQYLKYNPPAEAVGQESAHISAMNAEPTLQDIHRRLNAENIDLRGQLEMARKATSAAQELLEAERQKNAALNDKLINAEEARTANATVAVKYLRKRDELRAALDTEKLLRTNDAATIADLQRQLREATSQLKAQREAVRGPFGDPVWASKGASQWVRTDWANAQIAKTRREANAMIDSHKAENVELRRTISLMAKTAAEVQDNFRLIAELAADPADEARKIESDPF